LTGRANLGYNISTIDLYGGEFRAKTLTKEVAWIGYDRDGKNGTKESLPSQFI
jgi:hypothetical protein